MKNRLRLLPRVLGILFAATASSLAHAEPDYHRLADAIYVAEGGDKTRHPYGVKSIRTRSKAEARAICINTIRNTWRRYIDDGMPGRWINYLGRRYCPPSSDPVGHRNWIRNVSAIAGASALSP